MLAYLNKHSGSSNGLSVYEFKISTLYTIYITVINNVQGVEKFQINYEYTEFSSFLTTAVFCLKNYLTSE